jgi:hypothetical protein
LPVGGDQVAALLEAEIGLGRSQVGPVGRRFNTAGNDGDAVVTDPVAARVSQQSLDHPLRFLVRLLAEVVVPDPSFGVGDVDRRPVVVAEGPPERVVRVDRDRIGNIHVGKAT